MVYIIIFILTFSFTIFFWNEFPIWYKIVFKFISEFKLPDFKLKIHEKLGKFERDGDYYKPSNHSHRYNETLNRQSNAASLIRDEYNTIVDGNVVNRTQRSLPGKKITDYEKRIMLSQKDSHVVVCFNCVTHEMRNTNSRTFHCNYCGQEIEVTKDFNVINLGIFN